MEERGIITVAAGIIATVQAGLFACLEADTADRADRLGREVAFVLGQLYLAVSALAGRSGSDP